MSKSERKRAEQDTRDQLALRLRESGVEYRVIGESFGISAQGARQAALRGQKKLQLKSKTKEKVGPADSVEALVLGARARYGLENAGIKTVNELLHPRARRRLEATKNMGRRTIAEIGDALERQSGCHLGGTDIWYGADEAVVVAAWLEWLAEDVIRIGVSSSPRECLLGLAQRLRSGEWPITK